MLATGLSADALRVFGRNYSTSSVKPKCQTCKALLDLTGTEHSMLVKFGLRQFFIFYTSSGYHITHCIHTPGVYRNSHFFFLRCQQLVKRQAFFSLFQQLVTKLMWWIEKLPWLMSHVLPAWLRKTNRYTSKVKQVSAKVMRAGQTSLKRIFFFFIHKITNCCKKE